MRVEISAGPTGVLALAALAAMTQACVFDGSETVVCPSGRRCPTGWGCAAFQDECIRDGCGDGILDRAAGERCDDGNVLSGDGCSANCQILEGCGNGNLERDEGEVCDDGNTMSGDGCSADCLSDETCGNGYTDVGEVCDDGNTVDGDGCSADCTLIETCGDGDRDPVELCDDGNNVSGDGCSADCLSNERCGNGYTDSETADPEECDEGDNALTCDADCTLPACGDGLFNPKFIDPATGFAEQCDEHQTRRARRIGAHGASGEIRVRRTGTECNNRWLRGFFQASAPA